MDEATKERLRLIPIHDEKLRWDAKAKEQEYEHRKRMLNLEHGLSYDAAIKRTKEINKQDLLHREHMFALELQHRERLLDLEHRYKASASDVSEYPETRLGSVTPGTVAEAPKMGASVASLRNAEEKGVPNR